eukprot:scaffold5681_cov377-Prasinococcus_capsulatus_cf.AAC.12
MARASLRIEVYMQGVFMVSAASLFAPVLVRDGQPNDDGTITMSIKLKFLAFVLFEGCVGIFWPSIMKMRAQYIPEEQRATIMNFFRIPLNIFISANQRMTDCRGVSDRKHPHGVDVLAIGERGCITEEQNPIGYIYKCIVHKMAAAISVFLVHIAYGMDCVT